MYMICSISTLVSSSETIMGWPATLCSTYCVICGVQIVLSGNADFIWTCQFDRATLPTMKIYDSARYDRLWWRHGLSLADCFRKQCLVHFVIQTYHAVELHTHFRSTAKGANFSRRAVQTEEGSSTIWLTHFLYTTQVLYKLVNVIKQFPGILVSSFAE